MVSDKEDEGHHNILKDPNYYVENSNDDLELISAENILTSYN